MQEYILSLDPGIKEQMADDTSYIGGLPSLPASIAIPICTLCGSEQTFYFQVAFPDQHPWAGYSLAVFACTSCIDEDHLNPPFLEVELKGADIPAAFMQSYETNFKLLVFETASGEPRRSYREKVMFRRWILTPSRKTGLGGDKIGGEPCWILDDEAPATYDSGTSMTFLLQIGERPGYEDDNELFMKLPDAPPQIDIDFGTKGRATKESTHPYYTLFIGNGLYFYGTLGTDEKLVYVIPQCD